ncbi:hypothetical protein DPMN_161802 [Dreissena polymorpha]|uniref:Uncharacterized protein n=1 Tax=Dreissena polymorpha TaxID=45954 RepID=A0A9D4EP52_DREPO|nr:hypothetical protein DPMN_161802 [Dreissena polymorpha]
MMAESQYPYIGCSRYGSRKSVSVKQVCETWYQRVSIGTMGVPGMVVGSQCHYSRCASHGSKCRYQYKGCTRHGCRESVSDQQVGQTWQQPVSISTIGVPGMVVGSQCHYERCTRHGRRKSVSVQQVGKTW